MNRKAVRENELDFETPGRRDYFFCLEHPTLWAQFKIPVTVFVGAEAREGEGILAIGGTHGDEYEGPLAIKHLLGELSAKQVTGRILLLPTLNVPAFRASRRDTPHDGVNLNRAFPGDRQGTFTYQLARWVDQILFPHANVVLDIHSGGRVARFPLLAEFHEVHDPDLRAKVEATARGFGTPLVQIYQNLTPGLLTSRAEDLGKVTIGTELGWGRSVSPRGVQCARRGILEAAILFGHLPAECRQPPLCDPEDQQLVDTSQPESTLTAPFSCHFEPVVDVGDEVREGQCLGFFHDFERLDSPALEAKAPHDGRVICLPAEASVFEGQVCAQVGKPIPWASSPEESGGSK